MGAIGTPGGGIMGATGIPGMPIGIPGTPIGIPGTPIGIPGTPIGIPGTPGIIAAGAIPGIAMGCGAGAGAVGAGESASVDLPEFWTVRA
jgi:hypothetical protein